MKYTTTLVFSLLAGISVATPKVSAPKSDEEKCWDKNQNVVKCIKAFCGATTNLVAPSTFAQEGQNAGDGGSRDAAIYISGTKCVPPQWIPQEYCYSQFYNMCATGGRAGQNERSYGRDSCQDWTIELIGNSGGWGFVNSGE